MNNSHKLTIAETLRMFEVIRPHLRPEVAEQMEVARRAYEAILPKLARERTARRGDIVRHLANYHYRPQGLSDRRIAEDMHKLAMRLNPDREYLSEPNASIAKMIRLYGKVPSSETIRKDLR